MYYHQDETNSMNNHPNATITKFHFGKKISPELGTQEKQLATLSNGLSAQACFLLNSSTISDDKFLSSRYFHQVSTDSLTPNTPYQTSFSSQESLTPTGSPFLQSTSYLSVADPWKISQEKTGTEKMCSLSTITPTP